MRKLALIFLSTILVLPLCAPSRAVAQEGPVRRVHAPYFGSDIRWAETGLFWFGQAKLKADHTPPGKNYVDVRVAYTAEELVVFANVVDYFVWYDENATLSSDLTQYDAVALYLDTAHDRAATPQPDDYFFLSGLCLYGCGDRSSYRRQARGTGTGWDTDWSGSWTEGTWASWWCNPGPNSNDCGIDFGWWSYIHIPWTTLGRSGPPPNGTVWGLGVILYDRDDQPPDGYVAPETWPEAFSADNPSTWGELVFGLSSYQSQPAAVEGALMIRRGLGNSVVEDTWVGGGGTCSGGHEGDPDHDNHGSDTGLYVENQELIADFTCFSKSFLRFYLDHIPPGKEIISATLTIHHWGNAYPPDAQPSLIWLFTVDNTWEEHTIAWNTAPMAQENLSATWVQVITPENNPGWPGVAYEWDTTQAVAEAYAADQPLSIALYTADTNFHSSKYLTSSEAGDWNAEGRPTLKVTWGEPLATIHKQAWPMIPSSGEMVTYTLSLMGNGQVLTLTDSLPAEVSAPGSLVVSSGPPAAYEPDEHRVTWSGSPGVGLLVTVTFPVTVQVPGPRALTNTAILTDAQGHVSTDTATIIVDARQVYLPVVMRAW